MLYQITLFAKIISIKKIINQSTILGDIKYQIVEKIELHNPIQVFQLLVRLLPPPKYQGP